MKLLLFCNPNNIHNYNYIKNVLLKQNFDITIYSYSLPRNEVKAEYMDFYDKNKINVVGGYSISEEGHLKYIIKSFKTIGQLGKSYECLHVQYVSPYIAPIIFFYRNRFKKIVLTYWGSDLLRSNFVFRLMTKPLLCISSWITFITSDMLHYFSQFYNLKDSQKTGLLDFGNMFFEIIDQKKKEIDSGNVHKSLGLDPSIITVTIGYCWRKPMNQLPALHAIFETPDFPKEKIQIVLPTYGITSDAKKEMIEYLDDKKIRYKLFDTFMGPDEVSALRAVSDIFINPQTTDAFSSAMIEHLYAESVVINGSWLKYSILDEKKVYYKNFGSFNDLSKVLCDAIDNIKEEKKLVKKNRNIMASFCSWATWEDKWLELYK